MTAVFADTSFWIALTNEADAAYPKAQAFSSSLKQRKIITSESVLTEYLNYFAGWGQHFRNEVSSNVQALFMSRLIKIERHTPESFLHGLDLYRRRLDKIHERMWNPTTALVKRTTRPARHTRPA